MVSSNSNPPKEHKKLLRATKNPENLNEITKIIQPRLSQLYILAAASISTLILWSIFSRIPQIVPGSSILMVPNSLTIVTAEDDGVIYFRDDIKQITIDRLTKLEDDLNSIIESSIYENIKEDELQGLVKGIQNYIDIALQAEEDISELRLDSKPRPVSTNNLVKAGESIAYIFNTKTAVEALEAINDYLNAMKRFNLATSSSSKLSESYDNLYTSQQRRLSIAENLYAKGNISSDQLLSIQSSLAEYNAQLINQQRLMLNGKNSLNKAIHNLLAKINDSNKRFTISNSSSGYVVSSMVKSGMNVRKGDTIANFSANPSIISPKQAVAFLPLTSYRNIKVGDKTLISPVNIEESKYGSIVGKIKSLDPIPLGVDKATILLGGENRARSIFGQNKSMIAVTVDLSSADTSTGYLWSSSKGPNYNISIGTTGTVKVITKYISPISIVFPFIKNFF